VYFLQIMSLQRVLQPLLLLALVSASAMPLAAGGEKKDSPCRKPPEVASGGKPTKEEQKKARQLRAQGSVAISISEEGDVVDAEVVRASSQEAGDFLLTWAKAMKFKARPGCGSFKTTVNYTLD
jgi:hypothetical protein